MFHSVARAIQGSQLTRNIAIANGLVTVVDPVPQRHTRYFTVSTNGKGESMGAQGQPVLRLQMLGAGATVQVLVRGADGQLYGIHTRVMALNGVEIIEELATVLLAPGESVVVRLSAGTAASRLTVYSNFLDLQGPFEHQRVPLVAGFSDVIPSPAFGKIHTPVGIGGLLHNINSYLVEDGAVGGTADDQVLEGSTVLDTSPAMSATPLMMPETFMGNAALLFNESIYSGVIALRESMKLEARRSNGASLGIVAFASYLVTDDINA